MKKLLILFISALLFSININAKTNKNVDYQGKWVSTIQMTKLDNNLLDVTYTFTKDSLYIDVYPSGCPLAQMRLYNVEMTEEGFKCDALDTLYDIYKGDKIHEKKYHLEFKQDKLTNGEVIFKAYRDGTLIDIIKQFP